MNAKWTSLFAASILILTAGVLHYRNASPYGASSNKTDLRDAANSSNARVFRCKAFDDTGLLGIDALDLTLGGGGGDFAVTEVTLSNISGQNAPGTTVKGSLDPKYHPKSNTNYVRFTIEGLVDDPGETYLLLRTDLLQSNATKGTIKIQFQGEDFESSGYGCLSK